MDNELLATNGDVTEFYTKKITGNQRNVLIEKLRELERLFSEYSMNTRIIDNDLNIYKKMPDKKTFWSGFWPFFLASALMIYPGIAIFVIVIGIFLMLFGADGDAAMTVGTVLGFLIVGVIDIALMVGGGLIAKQTSGKKTIALEQEKRKKYEEIEEKKQALNRLGDELWEKSFLLPDAYCCEVACSYIAGCLEKYRAESMKEAFNLYEEQLHRWKLEEAANESVRLQQQQMALQQRQLNEIRGVKINSGISAAAGVYTVLRDIF